MAASAFAPLDPGMDLIEQEEETKQAGLVKEEAYRWLRSAARKYTVPQLGMIFAWVDQGKYRTLNLRDYSLVHRKPNYLVMS